VAGPLPAPHMGGNVLVARNCAVTGKGNVPVAQERAAHGRGNVLVAQIGRGNVPVAQLNPLTRLAA